MKAKQISQVENPRKQYYKRAAVNGAVATVGILGLSTTMDYFLRPDTLKQTINRLGGKGKYAKSLIATAAVFSVIGAGINTVTAFIMEKLANKK